MSYVALLFFVPGLLFSIVAFLRSYTTDLAVTNRKVLAKVGLIRRDTIEQKLATLDNVSVSQSIWGRFLGYGTINVAGSSGTHTPITFIAAPMKFRIAVQHAEEP